MRHSEFLWGCVTRSLNWLPMLLYHGYPLSLLNSYWKSFIKQLRSAIIKLGMLIHWPLLKGYPKFSRSITWLFVSMKVSLWMNKIVLFILNFPTNKDTFMALRVNNLLFMPLRTDWLTDDAFITWLSFHNLTCTFHKPCIRGDYNAGLILLSTMVSKWEHSVSDLVGYHKNRIVLQSNWGDECRHALPIILFST